MVDQASFRHTVPDYKFYVPNPDDPDIVRDDESEANPIATEETGLSSDDEATQESSAATEPKIRRKYKKAYQDSEDEGVGFVGVSGNNNRHAEQRLEELPSTKQEEPKSPFADELLLIANPVVLGFSFDEKGWLEFPVSCIHDVPWNDGAYDGLVLPGNKKGTVLAAVENHLDKKKKKNIDNMIQGKGRGLVILLHGPQGTGKTLTVEGIADKLRRPLYVRLLFIIPSMCTDRV
jgi:SpoVK/Ycf46/Vps4 family AAA+-type ATPase